MASAARSVLPHGSWPTPVTSELVVRSAARVTDVRAEGDAVVWAEIRPAEAGRTQLVRRRADGVLVELLPDGANVRSAVHEYGGGAWWLRDGVFWYVDWADQRLRRVALSSGEVEVLTHEPAVPRGERYADGDVDPTGEWIACVRERHPSAGCPPSDVVNEVVRLAAHRPSEAEVLVSGPDFVACPRWSDDGDRLCWVEWNHPAMPWDGTQLVVRDLRGDTDHVVAGGPEESVTEPTWQADGRLWFVSDRTGWYGLYRWDPASGVTEAMVELDADIGLPHWVFGTSRYVVLADGRVVFARYRQGFDGLGVRHTDGTVVDLPLPFSAIPGIRPAGPASFVLSAGSPTSEAAVHRISLDGAEVARDEVLRPPREVGLDPAWISVPEAVSFPTGGGARAHALHYPPTNPHVEGPPGQRPPLLVMIHGGPTAAARPELSLATQYWTTRGFAVVDVNYRGSTGYGRAYRNLLRGQWGVADVEDCVAAARYLADRGDADPDRLCIRGGSAGGFTTLAALAFHDTFAAGASHYGVADLGLLAAETHKFESRYLDSMVGPWPEERATYEARSPINHCDRLDRPLAVFQGLDDPIVPPNQAELIVAELRRRGVPVAYVTFEGEQHGFRQAENIRAALDGELSFYAQVLGFELPAGERIQPVELT